MKALRKLAETCVAGLAIALVMLLVIERGFGINVPMAIWYLFALCCAITVSIVVRLVLCE